MFLIFIKSNLSIFSFMVCVFCVLFKLILKLKRFLEFSPRSFRVFIFVSRSRIYFNLIFMYSVRWQQRFTFFSRDILLLQDHLLEILFFSLNYLDTFVKKQLAILVWICFWLLFIPLIYMSILMTLPHHLIILHIEIKHYSMSCTKYILKSGRTVPWLFTGQL